MKSSKPPKPRHRNLRIPPRLDDMVISIQQTLSSPATYTEALIHILIAYEKKLYLDEMQYIIKEREAQYTLIQNYKEVKKQNLS